MILKTRNIIILSVICISIFIAIKLIFFPRALCNIPIYIDLNKITKQFTVKYINDSIIIDGDLLDISGIKSDSFEFEYHVDLDNYDSILFLGEYPDLRKFKKKLPNLYDRYESFYSGLYVYLNSSLYLICHSYYIAFGVYKHGKIKFKTSLTSNTSPLIINEGFAIYRNHERVKIKGQNYQNKNGNITSIIEIFPTDSSLMKINNSFITKDKFIYDSIGH